MSCQKKKKTPTQLPKLIRKSAQYTKNREIEIPKDPEYFYLGDQPDVQDNSDERRLN